MAKRGEFFLLSNPIFLGGLVIALGVLLFATQSLDSKLLTGDAVIGEDYIGIIGGMWEVNEVFDARGCEEPKLFDFSYTAEIIQSGDKIIFIEDSSNRKMELTGYLDKNRLPLKGRFTLTKKFLEDIGDAGDDTSDEVFAKIDLNLEVNSDCSIIKGKGDWIAASADIKHSESCLGFSDLTATRIDGRNCEGALLNPDEKIPDFSGEWDFQASFGKGDPFSMTFYQDRKSIVVTSVGGTYNPPFDVSGRVDDGKLSISGNLRGASGQSVIELEFSDAILDQTCNSIDITVKLTSYRTVIKFNKGEDEETTTSFYTATRINPLKECKYISEAAKVEVVKAAPEKPEEIVEDVPEEKPAPSILPGVSYGLLILMFVLLAVIIGIAYLLIAITGKKRKLAKELDGVLGRINEDLARGDKQSALLGYKILTGQFERVKSHLKGKDKKRIYELSIKAYESLSQA